MNNFNKKSDVIRILQDMQERQIRMEDTLIRMETKVDKLHDQADQMDNNSKKGIATLRLDLKNLHHAPGPMHILEKLPLKSIESLDTFFENTNEEDKQLLVSRYIAS